MVDQEGLCQLTCNIGYQENLVTKFCEICIMQGATCQLGCDLGYISDGSPTNPQTCVKCTVMGYVDMNGICQNTCDLGYQPDLLDFNICKVCFFWTLYDQNGICVPDRCLNGYEPDATLICKSCLEL